MSAAEAQVERVGDLVLVTVVSGEHRVRMHMTPERATEFANSILHAVNHDVLDALDIAGGIDR